jgi:hypothetical protein
MKLSANEELDKAVLEWLNQQRVEETAVSMLST